VPAREAFVPLGDLRPGAILRTTAGGEAAVRRVRALSEGAPVYNIEVAHTHTYFAGGDALARGEVLVHNTCNPPGGAGNAPSLPSQLQGGPANTQVYYGVDKTSGDRVYVGITNNVPRRGAEHGNRFDVRQVTSTPLTRGEARAVEQALINRNPNFQNVRNSISPSHAYSGQAVSWGNWWLRLTGN